MPLQQLGSGLPHSCPWIPVSPVAPTQTFELSAPQPSWWCRPSHTQVQLAGIAQVLSSPQGDVQAHRCPMPGQQSRGALLLTHLAGLHAWPHKGWGSSGTALGKAQQTKCPLLWNLNSGSHLPLYSQAPLADQKGFWWADGSWNGNSWVQGILRTPSPTAVLPLPPLCALLWVCRWVFSSYCTITSASQQPTATQCRVLFC